MPCRDEVCTPAGGAASDGRRPIVEIKPDSIHQRSPFCVGTTTEVALYDEYIAKYDKLESPSK